MIDAALRAATTRYTQRLGRLATTSRDALPHTKLLLGRLLKVQPYDTPGTSLAGQPLEAKMTTSSASGMELHASTVSCWPSAANGPTSTSKISRRAVAVRRPPSGHDSANSVGVPMAGGGGSSTGPVDGLSGDSVCSTLV